MLPKYLALIAAAGGLALLAAVMPASVADAEELKSRQKKQSIGLPVPAVQKIRPAAAALKKPTQTRENRRAPIFSPPKTLKGKPMW